MRERGQNWFLFPEDEEIFHAKWMTLTEAAARWGVARSTVYRLVQRYPEWTGREFVWIKRRRKSGTAYTVVPADMPRPQIRRGNPRLRESFYQSEIARNREARRKEQNHERPEA